MGVDKYELSILSRLRAKVPEISRHCKTLCTLCLKNDIDVAHYNFNIYQPIMVIFGRDVAERVCYQMVFAIPPVITNVFVLPGET